MIILSYCGAPATGIRPAALLGAKEVKQGMANIKSAIKRAQIIRVRTKRNVSYKSMMKTAIRRFETALKAGDPEKSREALIKAIRTVDKVETKGVIHKNTASRKKSRLAKALNKVS
jgi:small subunit ribosomal protein S20